MSLKSRATMYMHDQCVCGLSKIDYLYYWLVFSHVVPTLCTRTHDTSLPPPFWNENKQCKTAQWRPRHHHHIVHNMYILFKYLEIIIKPVTLGFITSCTNKCHGLYICGKIWKNISCIAIPIFSREKLITNCKV